MAFCGLRTTIANYLRHSLKITLDILRDVM